MRKGLTLTHGHDLDSTTADISQPMEALQQTVALLLEQGRQEEANALQQALQELKKSLARVRMSEEGCVSTVH